MCKLFIATGRFTPDQTHRMLRVINERFSATQRDGFGLAIYGDEGKSVSRGRYLDPTKFVGFGTKIPDFVAHEESESGRMPQNVTAIIAHGRTSTNHINLHNCHPFIRRGVMLAHNGVLDWNGSPKGEPRAKFGCDTEQFLNWLIETRGDRGWMETWSSLETRELWSGYGVFGVLDQTRGELVVAKCGDGNLRWVGGNDVHVFSTEGSDAEAAYNVLSRPTRRAVPMLDNSVAVFDVHEGANLVSVGKWQGFGSSFGVSTRRRIQTSKTGHTDFRGGKVWEDDGWGGSHASTGCTPKTRCGINNEDWVKISDGTWKYVGSGKLPSTGSGSTSSLVKAGKSTEFPPNTTVPRVTDEMPDRAG